MLSIRKNWWNEITAFIALIAMVFAALTSSAGPGEMKAKIQRVGDGTAKVIFQPIGNADQVTVHNRLGEPIGKLNWAASFELSVTEDALRKATTKQGIDLNALLQGIGTVQSGDKTLVAAELPVAIKDFDGRDLAAGTQVFFGLDRLAKEGVMAPVVAWGGKSMGPGGAANEFNDRLLESGVQGQRRATPVAQGTSSHKHAYDGEARTPLDPLNELGISGQRFLSSPTCMVSSSQRMVTTSYYGKRSSFRTKNGKYATSFHDGMDIAGRAGTPIVAAGGGCVSLKDMRFNAYSGYGLSLVVDHGNGFSTQYSHMQNFSQAIRSWAKKARAGDKYCMERGEQIGNVGATGNCTGPHLHFGMKYNGKSVNPRNYMLTASDGDFSQSCAQLAASNEALKQQFGETAPTQVADKPWATERPITTSQSQSTIVRQ